MRKTILIDLRYLEHLNNGFGQLSIDYGNYIKNNPESIKDLNITLFVPEEYIGKFGNHVKYLKFSKKYKRYPFLLPTFDIWHSITQQAKYISLSANTVRIISVHDLNFLYERNTKKAKNKLKRQQSILDIADIVTAVSQFTIEDVTKHIDLHNKPILLNHVGVRNNINDKETKPDNIKSDKKFFFTIGQMREKKNFHVLLDLMKIMPTYNLYISGDNHFQYSKDIEKRIIDEKIPNVFITGPISPSEKIWMYKNCSAFLFPSKFEGFGIPVIEAMRFEKPVFSSRMTSLSEIGNKYAFFWDNFDAEHMKRIIDENMNNFYSNKQFIEEQKQYALSYTIDKHMQTYFNIYRNAELKKNKTIVETFKNYIKYIFS